MPLNRMVKPTSGICCEFAQKHDAEFMQNFFEKLLDKSVWRMYNRLASNESDRMQTADGDVATSI